MDKIADNYDYSTNDIAKLFFAADGGNIDNDTLLTFAKNLNVPMSEIQNIINVYHSNQDNIVDILSQSQNVINDPIAMGIVMDGANEIAQQNLHGKVAFEKAQEIADEATMQSEMAGAGAYKQAHQKQELNKKLSAQGKMTIK